MSERSEKAVSCFENFNCAQSVLATCGPEMGLDRESALRVAGGFGGGMGRLGEVCGAVTGAFMVIGLKHGKGHPEDDENETKEKAYALVCEFANRFRACYGSILCRELLGCDIGTPEGRAQAREKGLFSDFCPKLVQSAVEILEQTEVIE
jgi:C_GCAxxG_C_C family probable redox protein